MSGWQASTNERQLRGADYPRRAVSPEKIRAIDWYDYEIAGQPVGCRVGGEGARGWPVAWRADRGLSPPLAAAAGCDRHYRRGGRSRGRHGAGSVGRRASPAGVDESGAVPGDAAQAG